jgi:hypothetical protein
VGSCPALSTSQVFDTEADLFGFCLALVAYNRWAVVMAAWHSVHGETMNQVLSLSYVANNIVWCGATVHTDLVRTTQMDERIARLLTPALQGPPRGRTQVPPVETVEEHEKEAASGRKRREVLVIVLPDHQFFTLSLSGFVAKS